MPRAVGIGLAGIALTLVALMFDAAPLFVPGIAFTILAALAPALVWLGSRRARVRRLLDRRRVIEDEPLEASIEVDRAWLALSASEVIEPLAPTTIPLPRRGRRGTVRVVLRFARRGRRAIEPPSLVVRDPLDLWSRTVRGRGPRSELLVLPRTEPVQLLDRPSGADGGLAASVRSELPAAVEIDGLRPYQVGTPASRIHWPAVARGRGLLERRLKAEADTRPLIVLDARTPRAPEHLDAAVRAAASLALELGDAGGCGLLLPGDRRPISVEGELVAWPAVHARLALVEETSAPPVLSAARLRLGAVLYVAARPLDRLPSAAAGIARGSAVLVLPADVGPPATGGRPPPPAFAVSGCLGYVVRARARSRDRTPRPATAAGRAG